jgi:hypothetical protein
VRAAADEEAVMFAATGQHSAATAGSGEA